MLNFRTDIDPRIDDAAAALVPELIVYDIARSRHFWIELLGFQIVFDRPGFCYLRLGAAELMLTEKNGHRETGSMEPPLGRGINLQIFVEDADRIADRVKAAGIGCYHEPHDAWYRSGNVSRGYRQFLVQDPDGYLLRFATKVGRRDHA